MKDLACIIWYSSSLPHQHPFHFKDMRTTPTTIYSSNPFHRLWSSSGTSGQHWVQPWQKLVEKGAETRYFSTWYKWMLSKLIFIKSDIFDEQNSNVLYSDEFIVFDMVIQGQSWTHFTSDFLSYIKFHEHFLPCSHPKQLIASPVALDTAALMSRHVVSKYL